LLPVDVADDSHSKKALETALRLATVYDAKLHVMTVVPDFGVGMISSYFEEDFPTKAVEKTTNLLNDFAEKHIGDKVRYETKVCYGTIYDQIIETAKVAGCDLIVMGSHRPALEDYLIGPNAARVMRHSKQSVFIVRD
jgi:nucleotide-binding universal stress UspA family protein